MKKNSSNNSSYQILTGYVVAGLVSQEILNIITDPTNANKNIYFYDSFTQNSDCIDLLKDSNLIKEVLQENILLDD